MTIETYTTLSHERIWGWIMIPPGHNIHGIKFNIRELMGADIFTGSGPEIGTDTLGRLTLTQEERDLIKAHEDYWMVWISLKGEDSKSRYATILTLDKIKNLLLTLPGKYS